MSVITPTPSATEPGGSASIGRGKQLFAAVGCTTCHTPALQTAPSAHRLQGSRTVTPAGALTLLLDADRGLLQSIRGEERFDTSLGAARVARSRNTVAIALRKRLPVTGDQHEALLRIARRQARQAPGLSLAQTPDTGPQQEARIQRANLGDATQEQILAQLSDLDRSLTQPNPFLDADDAEPATCSLDVESAPAVLDDELQVGGVL